LRTPIRYNGVDCCASIGNVKKIKIKRMANTPKIFTLLPQYIEMTLKIYAFEDY